MNEQLNIQKVDGRYYLDVEQTIRGILRAEKREPGAQVSVIAFANWLSRAIEMYEDEKEEQ